MPQVSILMPVRNEERHLPAALSSLFRQSFKNWELIAVDDGSTDGTAGILRRAARTDGRVRVLSLPPSGVAPALNAGLSLCRAPLVARMDGDDICHPRRLEHQVRLLSKMPEITLAACAVRHFPRPGLQGGMIAYEKWQNALLDHDSICRDLFVESPFAHPSVVFHREAVERVGGYRDKGWAEDSGDRRRQRGPKSSAGVGPQNGTGRGTGFFVCHLKPGTRYAVRGTWDVGCGMWFRTLNWSFDFGYSRPTSRIPRPG